MLLGTLIKHGLRAGAPFAQEIASRDPALSARLEEEARRHALSTGDLIADTLGRFLAGEDGESWTTLVGNIQRADDPGFVFIETIVRKRLSHCCSH